MSADSELQAFLGFLIEPTFVLWRHGEVVCENAAATRLLGAAAEPRNLFDFIASPREELDFLLRRSSGSTAPLVGSVELRAGNGICRMRVHCARFPNRRGEGWLALRCMPSQNDQFSLLGRRVRDLNNQLRRRLHENAVLEEALRQNRVLMRELQHRVKNNIQMMTSLLHMSARGKTSQEVAEVVEAARLRLQAMASTQEAIYQSEQVMTVPSRIFLGDLVGSIGQSFGVTENLHLDVADAELSHDVAHCLALIVNELVTNAVKYGLPGGSGTVRVTFNRVDGEFRLMVEDSGTGIDADVISRSSGLKLVQGLCRQIGGAFEIKRAAGTRCTVRFGAPETEEAEA